MTVAELIKELQKYKQDAYVELLMTGTVGDDRRNVIEIYGDTNLQVSAQTRDYHGKDIDDYYVIISAEENY